MYFKNLMTGYGYKILVPFFFFLSLSLSFFVVVVEWWRLESVVLRLVELAIRWDPGLREGVLFHLGFFLRWLGCCCFFFSSRRNGQRSRNKSVVKDSYGIEVLPSFLLHILVSFFWKYHIYLIASHPLNSCLSYVYIIFDCGSVQMGVISCRKQDTSAVVFEC